MNVKKIQKNIASIRRVYYKKLINWIFSQNRDEQTLQNILNELKVEPGTLIKRLISYLYNYPHLISYFNMYMNDLYDFNKIDITNFLYTYCYMLDINNIKNQNKLFYTSSVKTNNTNRDQLYTLLEHYFTNILDMPYTYKDILFYCNLVALNAIPDEAILRIDELINNKQTIAGYNTYTQQQQQSDEIAEFCKMIKQKVKETCHSCPMYGRPVVVLDTNVDTKQEVDIMFIGLNPGREEVEQDKPFVGKSGQLLRRKISELPKHVKWIITNIILCFSNTENDIIQPATVIRNCAKYLGEIYKAFPAKTIVTLGSKATEVFGIRDKITKAAGKVYTIDDIRVIPVLHPSSAVNYGKIEPFNKAFETVLKLFSSAPHKITVPQQTPKQNEEVDPSWTLFDIKRLDNKIIKIFITPQGDKKYIIEEPLLEVYIKYGDFKACTQTTSSVDDKVLLTLSEYDNLQTLLRNKMKQMRKTCGAI